MSLQRSVCEFLSVILSDPCESYRNISEATRHHSKPASKESRERYCDRLDAPNWTTKSPDWSGPGFYRFVGSAGNQMAARVQVLCQRYQWVIYQNGPMTNEFVPGG